jgi:thiamine-monophosphate kinase
MAGGRERLGEFELISRLLAPLAKDEPGALGLLDDGAVLASSSDSDLVLTKDLMICGVHFLPDDPADLVARKLLRVNLSDLAAMGATPRGYLLGLCLAPDTEDEWVARFADGLIEDQGSFGVHMLGGDTTAGPGPVTLSLTAIGTVPKGHVLRRKGARPGDRIFVTGTIGDGALGLLALRGQVTDPTGVLADRYRLPQPRVSVGAALLGRATACLDVSDGLLADLGHLCDVSGVGARIEAAALPLSDAARHALANAPELLETVLTGGDDYELLFTAPPERTEEVVAVAAAKGVPVTAIGDVTSGSGVTVQGGNGEVLGFARSGYRHR